MSFKEKSAGRVERKPADDKNAQGDYRHSPKSLQDRCEGFRRINAAALAAGLPVAWYPSAKRHGHSLRVGNVVGEPGSSLWICLLTGAWKDHATGEGGGDLISLYAAREHIFSQGEAKRRLEEILGCSRINVGLQLGGKRPTNGCRAQALWREAKPISGTHVEIYLKNRGISIMPASLRFHSETYHGRVKAKYPAMIAAITRWPDKSPHAVHRTFLHKGNKADIEPSRMMLGEIGGGAVRLAPGREIMAVGEGIETCLSFQEMTEIPTWAVLSAGNYRNLLLPSFVKEIIVAADRDDIGLGKAHEAATDWARKGILARVVCPPERGTDFNDMHRGGKW